MTAQMTKYFFWLILLIVLVSFEKAIGLPLLTVYCLLQITQDKLKTSNILWYAVFIFLISTITGTELVINAVILLLVMTCNWYFKTRTTITILSLASLAMIALIYLSTIQLMKVGIAYFILVWIVLISGSLTKISRLKNNMYET